MIMKTTFIKRLLQDLSQRKKAHREHNLIGKWTGKKTRILIKGQSDKLAIKIVRFTDKLEVNTNLDFDWNHAKHGLVKFKQEYSLLILQTKQAFNIGSTEEWEIKKLTFNKLVLVQKANENQFLEHHFERSFDGYKD